MIFRFIIKPLIEVIIHAFLYDSPQTQLLLLSSIQIIVCLFMAGFQLKFGIFKIKGQFIFDFLL